MPMTDDRLCEVESPNAGMRMQATKNPELPALASVITNPRWAIRIADAGTDDELAKTAWLYFLAALNKSTRSPHARNTARRTAATVLINLAEDLSR